MRDLTHAGQHPTVLQKSKSKERAKVGCQKKKREGGGGRRNNKLWVSFRADKLVCDAEVNDNAWRALPDPHKRIQLYLAT